ncbi:MAG: type I-U CRISPR-associated protein Csx17 [Acidobacteria bacterium]|nr:type I-U CRISPR-associated protein Csx17 [Acidobacteriota bacterium]MBI3657494.1 type I-U CRISPR-associated protein Csx17 [Acidobacteriota bacterium]
MIDKLPVLRFEGIRPDSLGNYLARLGLISALSSNADWRGLRGCWRDGCFVITASEISREQIESYLLDNWKPTTYSRWWAEKQKADTKAKSDQSIWRGRSAEAISNVRLLDAHIAGVGRNQFNPVLYTGGKIGQRDLEKAMAESSKLIATSEKMGIVGWLESTLYGESTISLPEVPSVGTWFLQANKMFNTGQGSGSHEAKKGAKQKWFREGQLSPWSFLLALEGALLLSGSVSRRLSANARSYAVFPFITDIPSPKSENEVGLVKAEFWAPLWKHPASLPEVRALLERGQARIGQRTAKSPYEFAIAARSAGVDVGITKFVRFVLRQTTSSQVYEAVPGERIKVGSARDNESPLVEQIIPWLDRLPYEPRDSKQKGKFKGLRGPVEDAIICIAEWPDDAERWQRLLLLLAEMQSRIDRNKDLRERCRALNWLDAGWFDKAWPVPPVEIEIARAIASIGASGEMPMLANIFGVGFDKSGVPQFSGKGRPQRAIWHNGEVVRLMAEVLQRRLVDTDAVSPLPLFSRRFCSTETISAFLSSAVDSEMIGHWIPVLSLIQWREASTSSEQLQTAVSVHPADGAFLLQALFRPLFSPYQLQIGEKKLFPDHLRPHAAMTRRLLNLIRQGELSEAIQFAQGRYLAAGHSIVLPPFDINEDYERIAASLLIPIRSFDVVAGLRRWLQLSKNNQRGERK